MCDDVAVHNDAPRQRSIENQKTHISLISPAICRSYWSNAITSEQQRKQIEKTNKTWIATTRQKSEWTNEWMRLNLCCTNCQWQLEYDRLENMVDSYSRTQSCWFLVSVCVWLFSSWRTVPTSRHQKCFVSACVSVRVRFWSLIKMFSVPIYSCSFLQLLYAVCVCVYERVKMIIFSNW